MYFLLSQMVQYCALFCAAVSRVVMSFLHNLLYGTVQYTSNVMQPPDIMFYAQRDSNMYGVSALTMYSNTRGR